MSAEIVNLRAARKARARDDAAKTAATNRAAFGRTRAEKQADAAETAKRERALDGARLETAILPGTGRGTGEAGGGGTPRAPRSQ